MKFKKILSAAAAVILGFSVIAGCSDSDSKSDAKKDISSITAADVFSDMKVGWNLGNSLDSVGRFQHRPNSCNLDGTFLRSAGI